MGESPTCDWIRESREGSLDAGSRTSFFSFEGCGVSATGVSGDSGSSGSGRAVEAAGGTGGESLEGSVFLRLSCVFLVFWFLEKSRLLRNRDDMAGRLSRK